VNSVIDMENLNDLQNGETGTLVRGPYHLHVAVVNLLIPFWPYRGLISAQVLTARCTHCRLSGDAGTRTKLVCVASVTFYD
jgi:hypothetical protein